MLLSTVAWRSWLPAMCRRAAGISGRSVSASSWVVEGTKHFTDVSEGRGLAILVPCFAPDGERLFESPRALLRCGPGRSLAAPMSDNAVASSTCSPRVLCTIESTRMKILESFNRVAMREVECPDAIERERLGFQIVGVDGCFQGALIPGKA